MTYWAIYAFFRKSDMACFYVGQASDLKARMATHTNDGKFNPKEHFVAILESDIEPYSIAQRESFWIKKMRARGYELENKNEVATTRVSKRHFYVLNDNSYYSSCHAIQEKWDVGKIKLSKALSESWRTGRIAFIDAFTCTDYKIGVIDLTELPTWIAPDLYEI